MQLIWFRQDLRIADHAALWHASQAGPCAAVVFICPEQSKLHDDAPHKNLFYVRQLECLGRQLDALNIPLIIRQVPLWKDIPAQLKALCLQLKIQNLHANIEAGANEQLRDQQVQLALAPHHIAFKQYTDRTVFPLGSILNKSGQPYQVFGAFKKQCYERLNIQLPPCYPAIHPQEKIRLNIGDQSTVDLSKLKDTLQIGLHPSVQDLWPVSEQHAAALLEQFRSEDLNKYEAQRDFPNIDATSKLSPYLNMGILSIRQCLQAIFAPHGHLHFNSLGQQTWLDELLWREFYQHILLHFPQVSKHQPFKTDTQKIPWRQDEASLKAWQQGLTGIPIVDAGMRQLLQTGWMHNRVRMICAMFLSKNLLINWRLGEKWFMQHLIDGDLAANNGGWQWCASTGTDAVPYFRIFNPVSQSQKFDPHGDYIRAWLPELASLDAKRIHDPFAQCPQDQELDYPRPIVDLKASRLRAIQAFKSISS
jgi:deoxyribodipyrimidine photo-lyase